MPLITLVEQIESQIRIIGARKKPKTASELRKRDAMLQRYSEAASHFYLLKNAWRNHVMHIRTNYSQGEAQLIAIHVQGFITEMASWAKPVLSQRFGTSDG